MLVNTYLHVYGIGSVTELRLWREGLMDWFVFLEKAHNDDLPGWVKDDFITEIERSVLRLQAHDHKYFKDRLTHRELWRSFPEFRDTTVYLDIETTGLDQFNDDITVVGLFDGKKVQTFIKDKNLHKLPAALSKYSTIVSFNGLLFDMPFISTKFPDYEFDQIQLDLRFILYRLDLRGGLKRIERTLGISRAEETVGLNGFDAVKLWRKYEKGNMDALDLLIKYNTEDIVNLEQIMLYAYEKMKEKAFAEL
jgi:uncharacterized protein YprB with RNaseH-like and TPR domain